MPIAPRVTRTTPRGDQTRYPDADTDPQPCLVVLWWQPSWGQDPELAPAYRIGHASLAGAEPNAVLVRWWYEAGGTMREDWFRLGDVLDRQPDAGEWAGIVGRGVLG